MTTVSHRPVSGLQRGRAKALRREMTDAERKLWAELRGHRFQGLAFRRQSPIGPFIVDFVCHQHRLIVEIDGGQHFEDAGQKHDMRRETYFKARGYRVFRFTNLDVLTNREGVLAAIAAAMTAHPLPNPPPQAGEGAQERFGAPSLTLPLKAGGNEAADTQRTTAKSHTPLPNPPPQGGREQASAPGEAEQ